MKRITSAITFFLAISSCAQLNHETYLDLASGTEWKTHDYKDWYFLSYECETGNISVNLNSVLRSDGSAYFVMFAIPMPSGELQDKKYDGIDLMVHYGETEINCMENDIWLVSQDARVRPTSVRYLDERLTSCIVHWDYLLEEAGELALSFPRSQSCEIPSLDFSYRTGQRYKYDPLGY